jgi:PEP-CTERM motif
MVIRSSLFALVATACLLASYPASAVLITYKVDPGLTLSLFVFDPNNPNPPRHDISVSGSFTAEPITISNERTEMIFTNVKIKLSDSTGAILSSPVTLIEPVQRTDPLAFLVHDTGVSANFQIDPQPGTNLATGGHLSLLVPTTVITISGTEYFTASISPPNRGFTSVPEPSSLVAMVSAMGLLGLVGWRRKSK